MSIKSKLARFFMWFSGFKEKKEIEVYLGVMFLSMPIKREYTNQEKICDSSKYKLIGEL